MCKKNFDIQKLELVFVLGLTLVLNGGFFDYSVAVSGAAVVLALLVRLCSGQNFYKRDSRKIFLVPLLFLCIALAVSFWAVDAVENLFGALRLFVFCLWMWLLRCSGKEEREKAIGSIPFCGCMMVIVSVCAWILPEMRDGFWENDRLAGFFQYANTSALFLAVGIIILISEKKVLREKVSAWKAVQLIILTVGLLITGSRSVLLLFLAWAFYFAFKNRSFRKPFFLAAGMLALIGIAFVLITGNTQNIGRIFTLFSSNSTLWGRLLYDRDAFFLLAQKGYGLGRMGYYYSQGTFQSGVYHVRFVHNDFLQTALDYGIVALILLIVFLVWQFLYGKQERRSKEILLFLCMAGMVDFHYQYLAMLMVAALFLDYGEGAKESRKDLRENYVLLPLLFVVFAYLGVATGCAKAGRCDIALSMLPDYTYAQEKQMQSTIGTEQSYVLAQQLLQKNEYNIKAYVARGSYYASYFCIEECMADFDRVIELDPYNIDYYKQYDALLQVLEQQISFVENTAENIGDSEEMSEKIRGRREELPLQLKEMEERTSALAYQIKDVPQFSY